MSWLSDAWDTVSGWFDGGGSSGSSSGSDGTWLDRNWDTISKVANTGSKLYGAIDANSARQGSRNDINALLEKLAREDDAYQQQMYQYQQQQAAARQAAQRQNDMFKRKSANKAYKAQKQVMNQLIQQYQPYTQAMQTLTPKMAQNYGQFLDSTALLNQYLTPRTMNVLGNSPTPSWSQNIPTASYQTPKIDGPAVSFPTLDEILKGRK